MSNVTREDILKDAPDFVQIASKYMQDIYIDYEKARIKLDECPDRFLTYEGKNGTLHSIDLKYVNAKGVMKNRGASEDSIKDAQEIRAKILMPLLGEYNRARNKYLNAFDLYNNKSKALAKLTPMLLDYFGSMYSVKDVKKTIKQREGYDLDDADLVKFYNENKTLIEQRQAKFALKSDKYRVSTEAGRLEIINDMLTDLLLKYEDYISRGLETKALTMSREVRNLLEQARKEVKGNELKLTVDGKIDINATIHGGENISRVMRDIPINSIIIGLVSAKAGIKPDIMINQLAKSWYKDFNGFNKNILGSEQVMLPGDLIKQYNWEEIKEENKKFLNEMNPDIEEAVVIEEQDTKNKVLKRLKALRN